VDLLQFLFLFGGFPLNFFSFLVTVLLQVNNFFFSSSFYFGFFVFFIFSLRWSCFNACKHGGLTLSLQVGASPLHVEQYQEDDVGHDFPIAPAFYQSND